MTDNTTTGNRLHHLKGSDYEIADGEPDIRGWDVRDSNAQHLGKIEDLIFDPQARKVRYMLVKLDKNISDDKSRDVLVPIGLAELHKVDSDAFLSGISTDQLKSLPDYSGTVSDEMEENIRLILAGSGVALAGNEFYNNDHFKEDNLFRNRRDVAAEGASIPIIEEELNIGKRTVETGGAYIRSRVVETQVEETVNLQEERVTVERTAVDKPVSSTDFDAFKEGVIEMKEYAEVPVISKEARVVEEVTIGKEVNERDETVRDTVRSTEVEVEDLTGNKSTSSTGEMKKDN